MPCLNTQWFGLVLYPKEDLHHKNVLTYLDYHHGFMDYVAIDHVGEPDPVESVSDTPGIIPFIAKKDHTHVMVKTNKRYTPNSFVTFWGGLIKYTEPISNPEAYVRYMLHDTPQCLIQGKKMYPADHLYGCEDLIAKVLLPNKQEFIQEMQNEIMHMINDGYSFCEIYGLLCENENAYRRSIFQKCFPNFQSFATQAQREQIYLRKENKQ